MRPLGLLGCLVSGDYLIRIPLKEGELILVLVGVGGTVEEEGVRLVRPIIANTLKKVKRISGPTGTFEGDDVEVGEEGPVSHRHFSGMTKMPNMAFKGKVWHGTDAARARRE